MATLLSSAIIVNAQEQVSDYVGKAKNEYSNLETIINSLRSSNFIGDGSDGYDAFFREKISPALVENLTEAGSLMDGISKMLDSIKQQLLDTVDPQLGEINRDPSAH